MSENYIDVQILFIDDQKFLLKGLQRYFKDKFTCFIATTLEEIEQIMNEKSISIVVADQQMPDEIGLNYLRKLASEKSNIRRILTTSERHSSLVLNLINEGVVHGIVYTPLDRKILLTELVDQIKLLKL